MFHSYVSLPEGTQLNFGTLNYPDFLFIFGTWWMIVGEINMFVGGLGDYPSGQLNVVNLGSEHTHVCLTKSTQFSLLSPGPLKFFLLWSCFAPNKLMFVELGNPVTCGPKKNIAWMSWLNGSEALKMVILTLVQGISKADGKQMTCSKYHVSWLVPGAQIPAFDSSNPRHFCVYPHYVLHCIPMIFHCIPLYPHDIPFYLI